MVAGGYILTLYQFEADSNRGCLSGQRFHD